jgi:Domain of unknown function (DUF4234)
MPGRASEHVRSIALSILLTLVTCGLYNLYWQYRQMQSVNDLLERDEYSFWPWLLLTLLTCGLYHIYHEYRMSEDIARSTGRDPKSNRRIAVVLSVFGLSIVVDAIQQSHINAQFSYDARRAGMPELSRRARRARRCLAAGFRPRWPP